MHRQVDWRGLDFDLQLLDISELNRGVFRGDFDIAKASFHAAAQLADRTVILPCGSALGYGVGPLLLASATGTSPGEFGRLTLCPGEHTTAMLLLQIYYGDAVRVEHREFSQIMPALVAGTADFGVCIHEGRFTWKERGLHCVEDLGTRWEAETGLPLPLGGILARDDLPEAIIQTATDVIRSSIEWGIANRPSTLPTMRQYAQEFSDEVLFQHVDLYVNDWTVDLGATGRTAIDALRRRVPGDLRPMRVI